MADFCQGSSNSDLVDRIMKWKAWLAPPKSQRIRNPIRSGDIQLTSGQTFDQNFISGNFDCIKSCQKNVFYNSSLWHLKCEQEIIYIRNSFRLITSRIESGSENCSAQYFQFIILVLPTSSFHLDLFSPIQQGLITAR